MKHQNHYSRLKTFKPNWQVWPNPSFLRTQTVLRDDKPHRASALHRCRTDSTQPNNFLELLIYKKMNTIHFQHLFLWKLTSLLRLTIVRLRFVNAASFRPIILISLNCRSQFFQSGSPEPSVNINRNQIRSVTPFEVTFSSGSPNVFHLFD